MAISKGRVWGLLASVVALCIVLGGAVAFASPEDAANHNNDKERTLTVLAKSRQTSVVDVGDRGLSQGDARVINAPLYDESGKKKVGRLDLYCVTTDPADKANEKVNMVECSGTYTVPGGEISIQGVDALPKLPAPPPKALDTITGGTKKYEGARGEVSIETRGEKSVATFHFID